MLTCLRIVEENSFTCVDKKLCDSEDQNQSILSQISLGNFSLGTLEDLEAA